MDIHMAIELPCVATWVSEQGWYRPCFKTALIQKEGLKCS
jgi:hypothetical protein